MSESHFGAWLLLIVSDWCWDSASSHLCQAFVLSFLELFEQGLKIKTSTLQGWERGTYSLLDGAGVGTNATRGQINPVVTLQALTLGDKGQWAYVRREQSGPHWLLPPLFPFALPTTGPTLSPAPVTWVWLAAGRSSLVMGWDLGWTSPSGTSPRFPETSWA